MVTGANFATLSGVIKDVYEYVSLYTIVLTIIPQDVIVSSVSYKF